MKKMMTLGFLLFFGLANSCEKDRHTRVGEEIIDVVIVGGGFSGLAASYYLEDLNYLILEKDEKAGGRCQSGQWNGFHYPKGTEYIGQPEPYMKKMFDNLGVYARPIPPPTDGVAFNGNFYVGENLLAYLSAEEQLQYNKLWKTLSKHATGGIESAVFDHQNKLSKYAQFDKVSVQDWMTQNHYSERIQKFVNIENRGLFGTDNSNCSMLFNIPEMAYDLPFPEDSKESEVYSFDHGMYSIIDAFAARLGERLQTGARVTGVEVNADKTVSVTYVKDNNELKIRARAVIMTTPAKITNHLVSNHLSGEVRNKLSALDYSQYATINFFLKERVLDKSWSVSCIDEGQVVTIYDVIRPQVKAGYQGKSIISVYMAPENAFNATYINQSDEEFLKNAYQSLNKYYPDFEEKVLGYDITRFQWAFPIFSPNYRENIDVFRKDASLKGPVFLAGDFMVYATVDGAIISGEMAAEKVWDYLKESGR